MNIVFFLLALTLAEGRNVTFDRRSLIIDGERTLMLSGAVHYSRIVPEDWDRVFLLAKEMGLNTIQTYFFWNFHEQHRGNQSWTGRRDLSKFIEMAASYDLFVTLRIGPYICGEYYFGGLPVWLRNVDGIKCMRCSDPVWKTETAQIVATVVNKVRPLLAANGGPIVMLQIENEYNGGDFAYLDWAVNNALSLTTKEQALWNLCHDHALCARVNRGTSGAYAFKALCTINGFWMEEYTKNPSQPSPKWMADLFAANPGMPAIWTEDQGWFDQWGVGQRIRYSADQLYGIARFVAYGGSWHNHYMLTGGNNYGLQAGGDVVTAYAPDTVIDYLLLRHEPRFSFYSRFYHVLGDISKELLEHPIPKAVVITPSNATMLKASFDVLLQHCSDDDPAHPGTLDPAQTWSLESSGVFRNTGAGMCLDSLAAVQPPVLVACDATEQSQRWTYVEANSHVRSEAQGKCLSQHAKPGSLCHRCLDGSASGTDLNLWDCKQSGDPEQDNQYFAVDSKGESGVRSNHSGLCLTAASLTPSKVEVHEYGAVAFLSNLGVAEWVKVVWKNKSFVLRNQSVQIINISNGHVLFDTGTAHDNPSPGGRPDARSLASAWTQFTEHPGRGAKSEVSPHGPMEQLVLTDNDSDYLWYVTHVPADAHVTDKLTAQSGDGTILTQYTVNASAIAVMSVAMGLSNGGPGPGKVKGITGTVKLGSHDITHQEWTHRWMIEGEAKQIFSPEGQHNVNWTGLDAGSATNPLTWFRGSFGLPAPTTISTANPPQLAYALDLSPMWKGQAYVNGFHIGRYWLKAGVCKGSCAPPVKNGHCYMHWKGCGRPTQHLYHVPTSVLTPQNNLVVLFEEGTPPQDRHVGKVALVAVTQHPIID